MTFPKLSDNEMGPHLSPWNTIAKDEIQLPVAIEVIVSYIWIFPQISLDISFYSVQSPTNPVWKLLPS